MAVRIRGNASYAAGREGLCVYAYNVDAGRVECIRAPKPPYAFVTASRAGDARSLGLHVYATDLREPMRGRPVAVFEGEKPGDIGAARKRLGDTATFEADIPYVRRLLTDGELVVSYPPAESIVYVDIEVDDSRGFPKPGDRVLSISYSVGGGPVKFLYAGDYDSPLDMIREFLRDTVARGATVFAAWNVGFDWLYLYAYLREHGAPREDVRLFELFEALDLYTAYKGEVKGLPDYRLVTVAEHEGLEGVETKRRSKRVSEMTRRELEEYNAGDVDLLVQLDGKYGFTRVALKLAELVNLTVAQAYYAEGPTGRKYKPGVKPEFEYRIRATRVGDSLLIPRARELGYVLPNVPRRAKKGYPGAYVHDPRPGFYERVGVYDFASMYPNIIVNYKIDAFTFKGELLPHVESMLLKRRAAYKKLYKMTGDPEFDVMQRALKVVANALYGLFGTAGSRYLDEDKAASVTGRGRELILGLIRRVDAEWGDGTAVYGDTDSVFIDLTRVPLDPRELESRINEWVAPFRVKLEYIGKLLIQRKKRYVMLTEDGKWIAKGVELRRGDWDAFTKMVVESVVKMVFEGRSYAEIRDWLLQVKQELYAGKYDEMLVITKSIDPAREYKNEAEHVRAWRMMGSPRTVEYVRYVYVKGKDTVMPVPDNETVAGLKARGARLDYKRYWRRAYDAARRFIDPLRRGVF